MPDFDTYSLPPTQALVLEVLAARYRLGEDLWTFSAKHRPALAALEKLGLAGLMHGAVEHTCRAYLTDAGRKAALSDDYKPPLTFTRDRLVDALTRIEINVALTGTFAGKINAESMADAIIEALGGNGA